MKEVQVSQGDTAEFNRIQSMDHCTVTAMGILSSDVSPHWQTGYMIDGKNIQPEAGCVLKQLGKEEIVPDPGEQNVPQYSATVTVDGKSQHVDAIAWEGSGDSKTPLPRTYITYYFNGGKDLLWTSCKEGYHIRKTTSQTRSEMQQLDPDTHGIELSEHGLGSITLLCSR